MIAIKVWLLVLSGAGGASSVWGTGAQVSPHMFKSYQDCQQVARHLSRVNAKCVLTTVVLQRNPQR